MSDLNQEQSQQDPGQAPEAQEPEALSQEQAPSDPASPEPEAPGAEAKAKDGENVEDGDEDSEESEAEDAPSKVNRNGSSRHRRRAERQERIIEAQGRQIQQLTEFVTRFGGQPPAPVAPPKEKTPQDQAEEFFDSIVERKLTEREAKNKQLEEQAKIQAKQVEFQKRVAESRAAYDDFDDVVYSAKDTPVSPAIHQALLTSEKPGEIMYQLAKNPAELARISALAPLDAAREVWKLEAKAAGSTPQKPNQGQAARPPAPPSRVAGSASSTRRLEDLPISEYKRRMRSGGR